jgi:hypothetical protein
VDEDGARASHHHCCCCCMWMDEVDDSEEPSPPPLRVEGQGGWGCDILCGGARWMETMRLGGRGIVAAQRGCAVVKQEGRGREERALRARAMIVTDPH